MTHPHRLFTALVVHGALLAGCYEEDSDNTNTGDTDNVTEDTDSVDTGLTDTALEDTSPQNTGDCATSAECLNTDSFTECTADGVMCCWAAGECCDYCCGDLSG
jgi:hypothetical protein